MRKAVRLEFRFEANRSTSGSGVEDVQRRPKGIQVHFEGCWRVLEGLAIQTKWAVR